jgi:hypothetical protein
MQWEISWKVFPDAAGLTGPAFFLRWFGTSRLEVDIALPHLEMQVSYRNSAEDSRLTVEPLGNCY